MPKYDLNNRSEYWTDNEFKGISFLKANFRNLQYAPHVHEELVIAITSDGAGRSVTKHGSDITTPEQFLVYNPHEPHEGGAVKEAGWCYRAFYIDSAAVKSLSLALSHDKAGTTYFSRNCIHDRQLAAALLQAHSMFELSKDPVERQGLLLDVISTLYARYGEPQFKPMPLGCEKQPLKRTIDYMHTNYASSISMAELAALARFSEFHFMRVFRKHFGLSPHTYLTQIRLKAARRMLEGGMSSTEAAAEAGFFDQSHLMRHFKRVYGITPQQFIVAVRKKNASPAMR